MKRNLEQDSLGLFDAVCAYSDAPFQLFHVHRTIFNLAPLVASDLTLLLDRPRKVALLRHCGEPLVMIQDAVGTLIHGSVLLPYPPPHGGHGPMGPVWPWDRDRLHIDAISDCLGLVLSWIKRPRDLLSARRVCREWCHVHDSDSRVLARWGSIIRVIERRGWYKRSPELLPALPLHSLYAQYMFIGARFIGKYIYEKRNHALLLSLARAVLEYRGYSVHAMAASWTRSFGCVTSGRAAPKVMIGPRGQFILDRQSPNQISESDLISSYFKCTRLCESDLPWN
jgi:hypothetical protein